MFYYDIIRCGAVVVCISSAYRSSELVTLLKDAEPVCLVTSENLVDNIPEASTTPFDGEILVIERDNKLLNLSLQGTTSSDEPTQIVECNAENVY